VSIYLDEFETLYGISSNIQELKHKIFDLAFEGKLTEQDYSEEEVSNLSNNIKNERNRLIKEKIITKPRGGLEEINNDEITKIIPDNWKWLKLGEVVYMLTNRKKENGKLPYIVVKVLRGTKDPKIKNKGQIVNKGDYVILVDGENSGEVFTVNQEGYLGSTLRRLKFNKYVNKKYLLLFLKKQHIFLKNRKKGAAIPHLNKTIFRNINFPLPPIEEQKRIVEKIEKLMKEVDKLEVKLEERENISQEISESIVEAIKSSKDAEELKESLRFVIDNFDVIFKTSESMEEMKNIVLQLAIEGKLVPQDDNDEPASELIKKINTGNSFNKIKKENHYFEIPSSWVWTKYDDIIDIRRGASPRPIKQYLTEDENGVHWIKIGDATSGGDIIKDTKEKITKEGAKKSVYITPGTLIMSNSMSYGKPYISGINGCVHDGWLVFNYDENLLNTRFLKIALSASYKYFEEKAAGSGIKNLNISRVASTLVPVPPYEEQKRIVKKVDLIMSIINKLEKELIKKEDLVEKLGSI